MWLPYKIFFVIFYLLTLPLTLVFYSLLILYKLLILVLAKVFQDFVEPAASANNLFIFDKIWSRPSATILAGVELTGKPTEEDVVTLFQNVYNLRDEKGRRCYRELGYKLVIYFGHSFWKEVHDFKIIDRVHVFDKNNVQTEKENQFNPQTGKIFTIPIPAFAEESLNSIAESLLREPYKENQPLWDAYLIHNYNGNPTKTLVLIRFHHFMADGMSFIKFLFALTGSHELPQTQVKPKESMQGWQNLSADNILTATRTFLNLLIVGPVEMVHQVLFERDKHPVHYDPNGNLKLKRNWICSMSKKLDLAEMRKASKSYGYSFVHVLLAGLSGGLERYFDKYHAEEGIPKGFHFMIPLPIPKHPNLRLVNHWCLAKFYAKTGIENTVAKLQYFKEEAVRCATSTLPLVSAFSFLYVLQLLPRALAKTLFTARTAFTLVPSNVVGPQDNRQVGEFTILDMFFYMPIVQENCALATGIISCNGQIRICLTADTGCIPDRSRLEDLGVMINDELNNICKLGHNVSNSSEFV